MIPPIFTEEYSKQIKDARGIQGVHYKTLVEYLYEVFTRKGLLARLTPVSSDQEAKDLLKNCTDDLEKLSEQDIRLTTVVSILTKYTTVF